MSKKIDELSIKKIVKLVISFMLHSHLNMSLVILRLKSKNHNKYRQDSKFTNSFTQTVLKPKNYRLFDLKSNKRFMSIHWFLFAGIRLVSSLFEL